jgi:hypothetical protein
LGRACNIPEEENGYRILIRKSERKRPLGIRRYRWKDIIKIDCKGIMGDYEMN